MIAADDKYLLCRPDSGLNDILCQIELMHRYATQTKRRLIVDTSYEHSLTFRDRFSRYFTSKDKNLILDPGDLRSSFDLMSVFPPTLERRVNAYHPWVLDGGDEIVDRETGARVSFDLNRDYKHQLLVHHAYGGGTLSLFALTKLIINDDICNQLVQRMTAIGSPYSAIHIRNTDYKSYYISALERIKNTVITPIFIATDDLECRKYCTRVFGAENVRYFSDLPTDGRAIHYNDRFGTIYQRNADAILDLLMLALSTKFHRVTHDGTLTGRVRGYTVLAENLITYNGILLSLFGTNELALATLKRAIEWRRQTL